LVQSLPFNLSARKSLEWLWAIFFVNLAPGVLLWGINTWRLWEDDYYRSELESILYWQALGAGFLGFAVVVLVATLATTAIVAGERETAFRNRTD
jgi:hypothetical protein